MEIAENTITPFKHFLEPGWRRNKASAQYVVATPHDGLSAPRHLQKQVPVLRRGVG